MMNGVELLDGLRPELRKVVFLAAAITPVPFKIVRGVGEGRHAPNERDGLGRAVDLEPDVDGVAWNDEAACDAIAAAMIGAGDELGVVVRYGADYKEDGEPQRPRLTNASPHFEV